MRRAVVGGEAGRGVETSAGIRFSATGAASWGGSGDKGSRNFFSWIELTTFSRPIGVMCLPRAWLVAESWRRRSGREAEVESDREVVVMAVSRLESSEATLLDSSGISAGNCCSKDHCGETTLSGWQQKVSRDHSLHAMFSYRLPSSMAGEHRAKTVQQVISGGQAGIRSRGSELHSPDQRPKRFSVLRVSMVRIELCSTRTMGRSAWSGIVCVRVVSICGCGVVVVVRVDGEGAMASMESSRASSENAGVTTAVSDTWRDTVCYGGVLVCW
jgi:hypothetical protein